MSTFPAAVIDRRNLFLNLEERLSTFRMIILGTYKDKDIVDSTIEKGVKGNVFKQSMAIDLPEAVDRILNGEAYVSPLVVSA